jgi:G3E family GTPase
MGKLPVNIISEFLGSGKTTAIIKLLSLKATDEHWAVIINEFGKISIDSQTLRSISNVGKVFDISGGCICCTAKGYLKENIEEIIQSGKYSHIIIEPNCLGGIDMVSEKFIGALNENPGAVVGFSAF